MTELVKAVTPARGQNLIVRGDAWVAGYVVRAADVETAQTPTALFDELGLGYAGSPFQSDADQLDVLRIPVRADFELATPGAKETDPAFVDESPLSGTGFVESARGMVPYWWLAPAGLPAGTSLWRYTPGAEPVMLAGYVHLGIGWVSTRPDYVLPVTPVRLPQLAGVYAQVQGETFAADVLPDGTVVVVSADERTGMQSSPTGIWWRELAAGEVEQAYSMRLRGEWNGAPVQVVNVEPTGSSDVAHVVYLGHDAHAATELGFAKTEIGVYEQAVDYRELSNLAESRIALEF